MDIEFPKIIWVCIPKRPNHLLKGVFNFRGRFSAILEDHLLDGNKENHYIKSIEVESGDFDISGNLTAGGKNSFWLEVIHAIEKIDIGKITLHPRKYKPISTGNNPKQVAAEWLKLPTPPPVKNYKDGQARYHES